MYFAGNAVATAIIGAISGNLIYEYIKNIFYVKGHGLTWAEAGVFGKTGIHLSASEAAYMKFNDNYNVLNFIAESTPTEVAANVFNFGNLIVPFIVSITCILGVFLAFRLPKDFTQPVLAEAFRELDPTVDTSAIETREEKDGKGEIIFVQVGLSVLSGFIFGFIWSGLLLRSVKELRSGFKALVPYLVSAVIPFASIYFALKTRSAILEEAEAVGANVSISRAALIVSGLLLPILPVNVIALSLLQNGVNKLYTAKGL
jgi:hypothetical protein